MTKFAIRVLTLAMYALALTAVPMVNSAKAAGGDNPSPPTDSTKDKKKKDRSSSIDDPRFIEGYRTPTPRFTIATITPRPSSS